MKDLNEFLISMINLNEKTVTDVLVKYINGTLIDDEREELLERIKKN